MPFYLTKDYHITIITTTFIKFTKLILYLSLYEQVTLLDGLVKKNGNFTDMNSLSLFENILKVEVYYQEFNIEEIAERPAYIVSCKFNSFNISTQLCNSPLSAIF